MLDNQHFTRRKHVGFACAKMLSIMYACGHLLRFLLENAKVFETYLFYCTGSGLRPLIRPVLVNPS